MDTRGRARGPRTYSDTYSSIISEIVPPAEILNRTYGLSRNNQINGLSRNNRIQTKPVKMSQKEEEKKLWKVNMPSAKIQLFPSPAERCVCPSPKCVTTLVDIAADSKVFEIINDEMQSSIVQHVAGASGGGVFKSYNIIKIERVANNCMWTRFRGSERRIASSNRGNQHPTNVNEKFLFHGSPSVDQIIQNGFDINFANASGMFGKAIYFAEHSSKSNQYAFGYMGGNGCPSHRDTNCYVCERKMLLCRVALGYMLKLKSSQKYNTLPAPHHSVAGTKSSNLRYPEYAIFDMDQAYPEYVITYKIVAN